MEDRLLSLALSASQHLLIVADGHGGHEASEFVIQSFKRWKPKVPKISSGSRLSKAVRRHHSDMWIDLLHAHFEEMDQTFRSFYTSRKEVESSGTTICGVIVDCEIQSLIVFNLGDSQSVIFGKEYQFITTPHTVKSVRERKKVLSENPNAKFTDLKTDPRLYGLNMTRAFGNYNIRGLDKSLNREIDYNVLELEPNFLPLEIVVATDGLFDEISAKQIATLKKTNANQLLQRAQEIDKKGDNIAILHAIVTN